MDQRPLRRDPAPRDQLARSRALLDPVLLPPRFRHRGRLPAELPERRQPAALRADADRRPYPAAPAGGVCLSLSTVVFWGGGLLPPGSVRVACSYHPTFTIIYSKSPVVVF